MSTACGVDTLESNTGVEMLAISIRPLSETKRNFRCDGLERLLLPTGISQLNNVIGKVVI